MKRFRSFSMLTLAFATASSIVAVEEDAKQQTTPDIPTEAVPEILKKLQEFQSIYSTHQKELLQSYIERFREAASSEQSALNFHALCTQAATNRGQTAANKSGEAGSKGAESPLETLNRLRQERAQNQDSGRGRRKGSDGGQSSDDSTSQNQEQAMAPVPGKGAFLQLQLEYLIFTIEATSYTDRSSIPARFKDFSERAIQLATRYLPVVTEGDTSKFSDRLRQELQERKQTRQKISSELRTALVQDVYSSAFAVAGGVETHFKKEPQWPGGPLDLKSIYENHTLPPIRKSNLERLGPAWDEYIAAEATLQRALQDDTGYARWHGGEMKDLEFRKWLDVLIYSPNRDVGLNELVSLFKNNPQHPRLSQWIKDMANLEKSLSTPSTKSSNTSSPP